MDEGRRIARRGDWEAHPLTSPEAIPPPARTWSSEEMERIRAGYVPSIMEQKWFIFVEGDRLFAHRSWTGLGVYEAIFAPVDGGYVIESAVVTGNRSQYKRFSDQDESLILEEIIAGHLLGQSLDESRLAGKSPHLRWELSVPNIPKEAFILPVVERASPELNLYMGDITELDVDAIVNAGQLHAARRRGSGRGPSTAPPARSSSRTAAPSGAARPGRPRSRRVSTFRRSG